MNDYQELVEDNGYLIIEHGKMLQTVAQLKRKVRHLYIFNCNLIVVIGMLGLAVLCIK